MKVNDPFVRRMPIAICDLLIWAYRDQMVHVARPEHAPIGLVGACAPRLAAMQFGADPVDASHGGDFEAAYDAWRVHDAVMALPETVEWHLSSDEVGVCQARAMLRGDATGGTAVRTVRLIPLRSVVFQSAMQSMPPDWCPWPDYRWAHQETGPRKRYGEPIRFGKRHDVAGHLVRPIGDDPWQVQVARVRYGLWSDALMRLSGDLGPRLHGHVLTGELPPAAPWLTNQCQNRLALFG